MEAVVAHLEHVACVAWRVVCNGKYVSNTDEPGLSQTEKGQYNM